MNQIKYLETISFYLLYFFFVLSSFAYRTIYTLWLYCLTLSEIIFKSRHCTLDNLIQFYANIPLVFILKSPMELSGCVRDSLQEAKCWISREPALMRWTSCSLNVAVCRSQQSKQIFITDNEAPSCFAERRRRTFFHCVNTNYSLWKVVSFCDLIEIKPPGVEPK